MNAGLARGLLSLATLLVCIAVAETLARALVVPAPFYRDPQVRYKLHPTRSFTLERCQNGVFSYEAPVRVSCMGFRTHRSQPELESPEDLRINHIGVVGSEYPIAQRKSLIVRNVNQQLAYVRPL